MTDRDLAQRIIAAGFNLSDARVLQPGDRINLILGMTRGDERRVLALDGVSATEADHRLREAKADGWAPARIISVGEPKPIVNLGFRRAAAYVR